jgi:hypothetical protein
MGIPYAFRLAGMLPGCVLLIAVGLVSENGVWDSWRRAVSAWEPDNIRS